MPVQTILPLSLPIHAVISWLIGLPSVLSSLLIGCLSWVVCVLCVLYGDRSSLSVAAHLLTLIGYYGMMNDVLLVGNLVLNFYINSFHLVFRRFQQERAS